MWALGLRIRYMKQLNKALQNATAAGDGKLLGLLLRCKKMTKWYFLQRSDTEDVLKAVNQVINITGFNITDGNIKPRRNEKQESLPAQVYSRIWRFQRNTSIERRRGSVRAIVVATSRGSI